MEPSPAPRELVLVAEPDLGLAITPEGLVSATGVSLDSLNQLLTSEAASLENHFGLSEELMESRAVATGAAKVINPGLFRFYKVWAPDDRLEALAEQLRGHPVVHAAFTDYRDGKGDFADYLIGRRNAAAGCEHTVTFDKDLVGHPAFVVL